MRRLFASAIVLLLGVALGDLASQDAENATLSRLTLTVEFIELEQQDWKAWTGKPGNSITGPALRNHAQELIKADKAFVVHSAIQTGMEKERTTLRSGGEYIFPTEYDPPWVGPDGKQLTTASPHAHQTRYTGFMVETEFLGSASRLPDPFGVIPDTRSHVVDLETEFVERLRNLPLGEGDDEKLVPLFFTLESRNTIRCAEGESLLLGTHRPNQPFSEAIKNPVLLAFARLEVHEVANAKPKSKP